MVVAEPLVACGNHHGEGIFWNAADGRVWWTDIEGRQRWWYEPEARRSGSLAMPDRVCCFAPRAAGGFIVALAREVAFYEPATKRFETVYRFEPDNPGTRLNDGRTDRQGRLVAGGMNEATGAADSSVIRVAADGRVTTLIEGVACANSICFSPDGGTMYFADTPDRRLRSYAYGASDEPLGAPRLIADFAAEPGAPDGSCVDAEGGVWTAEWEGGRVVRTGPDGRFDRVVELPVGKPTCCAFGGPALDTLFITTSRFGSSPERLRAEPHAGDLFAVRPGIAGLRDAPFAG